MKKTLLVLAIALMAGLTGFAQITDTIVSTAPSNRNVLIEEYTGINCQYCPDGHKKANEIKAAHPDRVCIINIHQGSYANNTYTTAFGDALADQTGLDGYPSGTVNRHVFSGGKTAMDRGQWSSRANQIMNMTSPVNIAAEATYDWSSNIVTIRVQLYYTEDQTVTSNLLNVAILQDSVLGSQAGSSYNPSQVVGNQYRHMHMLRHLITGQWGETINTIAAGTLVEKVYTYEIPGALGSPNPISAVPKDLRFVSFVTEGHQEVLTACEIEVNNIIPEKLMRVTLFTPVSNTHCDDEINGSFQISNYGMNEVSSAKIVYAIDGTTVDTIDWTGSLIPNATSTITIPTMHIPTGTDVELTAKVVSIQGEPFAGSTSAFNIRKEVYSVGGHMTFVLYTDAYASETRFRIYDPNNIIVLSGGPWTNASTVTITRHEFAFDPTTLGCHRLEVLDSYGDGINAGYGEGYFELLDAAGNVIFHNNGRFGSKATYMLDVTQTVNVEDFTNETVIYPNPATDLVNISTTENVKHVEIFNMQGQLVKVETGEVSSISVKELANGMYTMKLTTDNGVSMHKIIKR
jgi:hypothetical protein